MRHRAVPKASATPGANPLTQRPYEVTDLIRRSLTKECLAFGLVRDDESWHGRSGASVRQRDVDAFVVNGGSNCR